MVFSDFEVPERIAIGGRQRLAVHTLPGGVRVVDAMGPDDAPIRWSGIFSGQNAAERARTLERLRRSGDVLLLSWDGWRFSVIVQEVQAEITNAYWIPYSIELCVVSGADASAVDWLDAAAEPLLTLAATGDMDQQIDQAGGQLNATDLGVAYSAAGELAQLVTRRAYNGANS